MKNSKCRKYILKFFSLVLIISFVTGVFGACSKNNTKKTTVKGEETSSNLVASESVNPLTGTSGINSSALGKRPIAVVISNAVKARPQWGLTSPDIIVEGVAEGGVTRMLGFYSDVNSIPKVGPIRSARHDFVEIAQGFDAIFVHWGGSTYAYKHFKDENVDHLDGITGENKYFKRDPSRKGEHSGYTKGDYIKAGIEKHNFRTAIKDSYKNPLKFYQEGVLTALPDGSCKSIKVSFSQDFNHTFKYDAAKKLYMNYMNETPMKDYNGNQMGVTNVIVMYAKITSMGDSAGCIDMDLSSGSGLYVSGGTYQKIIWRKGSSTSMLRFFNEDGKELTLNAGKSWIGIVPLDRTDKTVVTGNTAAKQ